MFQGDIVPVHYKIISPGEPVYPGNLVRWASTYPGDVILAQDGPGRASPVAVAPTCTANTSDMYLLTDSYVFDDFAMGV